MKKSINYRLLIHIAIWAIVLSMPYLVSNAAHNYSIGFIPGSLFVIETIIHIGLFYSHSNYIYRRFFNKKQWPVYTILSLLVITAANMLKLAITKSFYPDTYLHSAHISTFIYASSVDIFSISLIYCRVQHRLRQERLAKEKEAAFLQSELRFLRSQISPHFLFNVLTNLVSLARKNSTQLEPSLIRLADLMRYMLYETQGKKVPLQKEIEYLESYIQLQQLRFGSDLAIQCDIPAAVRNESLTIEPMLLIPFVENAFKHSSTTLDQPLICIQLSLTPLPNQPAGRNNAIATNTLTLNVRNNFDPEQQSIPDDNSGIGLQNVKTRLEMLYKNNYTLNIRQDDSLFYITLQLNIS